MNWQVYWGPVYPLIFDSDSGNVRDLNAVNPGEKLATQVESTGYYGDYDVPGKLGFFQDTADKVIPDKNVQGRTEDVKTEAEAIKAAAEDIQKQLDKTSSGTLVLDQTFVFADARTGTGTPLPNPDQKGAQPILNSGFQLVEIIQKTKAGKYTYHVSRTAQKVGDVEPGEVAQNVKPVTVEIKVAATKEQG